MECISGYLHLIAKLGTLDRKYCSSYNIGPNTDEKRFTVEDITKIFIETAGKGSYEIETQKPQLHEAGLLLLNNNKAKRELNWLPKYSTKEAIEISAKWYAEYLNNSSSEKLLEFTNSQISDYLNAN